MNSAVRLRLSILIGAIALMAALLLWGVQHARAHFAQLERQLTANQLETLRTAGRFEQQFPRLEKLLLEYTANREEATWRQFENTAADLHRWLEDQASKHADTSAREVLGNLNRAYDDYWAAAQQIHTNGQPAMVGSRCPQPAV